MPKQGERVEWWVAQTGNPLPYVTHYCAVYVEHAAWADLFGGDDPGAPFVAEWLVFRESDNTSPIKMRDGSVEVRRSHYWSFESRATRDPSAPDTGFAGERMFARFDDAYRLVREWLRAREERLQEELQQVRQQLAGELAFPYRGEHDCAAPLPTVSIAERVSA